MKPSKKRNKARFNFDNDVWWDALARATSDHANTVLRFEKDKAIYLRHIKRLQDQCKVLAEVIAEERALRQKLKWWNRVYNRCWPFGHKRFWKMLSWCIGTKKYNL